MDSDELMNKLFDMLNDKSVLTVRITDSLRKLLETLKIIENCVCCKDDMAKNHFNEIHKSIKETGELLNELEEKKGRKNEYRASSQLIKMDIILDKELLCEGCR